MQITVTKEKVANTISKRLGFSSTICEEIVGCIFEGILDITKEREKLTLRGFGSWKINRKNVRPGLNPKTGDIVEIKPRTVLRFISSRVLKNKINQ